MLDGAPDDEPKELRVTAKTASNKVLENFLEEVGDSSEEKARKAMLDKLGFGH